MKWILLSLFLIPSTVLGVQLLQSNYDNEPSIFSEFRNLGDRAQTKNKVVTSTPSAIDLEDGQFAVYQSSSNAQNIFLMLRVGTTIYASPAFPIIKVR